MSAKRILLEFSPCPLCASRDASYVYSSKDLITQTEGTYSLVKCNSCKLVRTQPRPIETCIGAFYPDNYGPYLQSSKRPCTAGESRFKQYLKGIAKKTLRLLAEPSYQLPEVKRYPIRLLDYGCASGGYIASLDKNDYDTVGIDFSESALNQARCLGLNILAEPLPVDSLPRASFDIITAWMVVEHLYNPVKTLRKLRVWLRDDGFIVISVPDYNSLHRKVFRSLAYDDQVPTHLLHFTPGTISMLLKAAGFQVLSIRWQPNARTLIMSLKLFLESYMPRPVNNLFLRLTETKLFKAFSLILGYLLAACHQSGRMRITARKALSSY